MTRHCHVVEVYRFRYSFHVEVEAATPIARPPPRSGMAARDSTTAPHPHPTDRSRHGAPVPRRTKMFGPAQSL